MPPPVDGGVVNPVPVSLARAMGGDLTYHHDGEAVFTISFPLVTAPATALV